MKPLRLALFIILLIFHATLVILSLNFSQSLADSIVRNPSAFRFLTFFGLTVFLITFAFGWFDRRRAHKRIEKLEAEKNAIKAEVFDREQRAQEREREIEREIKSFEKSLPTSKSSATEPGLAESRLTEPGPAEPRTAEEGEVKYGPLIPKDPESGEAELSPTESRPTEPGPAEPRLAGPPPAEEDEVEYGPLTPKEPETPKTENNEDRPDTNPFRS